MIRKATEHDIPRIIDLLHQVDMVHCRCRPDIFKPDTTKYNSLQLRQILAEESQLVFVYEDECVLGYAIGQVEDVRNDVLLQDMRSLYIDDICVDESARGRHIGTALFNFVRNYAKSIGCEMLTLNVWEGNDSAMAFYRSLGMKTRKTCMEIQL